MHWNITSTFKAERGAVSQQPSWPATSASPETTGSLQQQMSPKDDSLACDYTCSLETQQGHQGNMSAQTQTGPAPASALADQPGCALWGLGTPCTIGSHQESSRRAEHPEGPSPHLLELQSAIQTHQAHAVYPGDTPSQGHSFKTGRGS